MGAKGTLLMSEIHALKTFQKTTEPMEPAPLRISKDEFLVRSLLTAEGVERKDTPGAWGVEAIDIAGDGEIYMAVFYGPGAKERAMEYARVKYAANRSS